ncbi:4Fe-4S binding protein [uncultured Muribaculum sp.]|uniref:4Fe-4S binding protein n=2 Tax=uncultured Muribaculum sp. TaxID=1918613 RepID=UPI0025AEFB41|nr:4Fe-4S binding protein [uncultured Muribaculum sp.]
MTYLIVFSPTGTSRKIGESIVRGIGGEVATVDLTYAPAPALNISKEDLAVFVAPVYGGRLPVLAKQRMAGITSSGAKAVGVCVYGNRAFEKALVELDNIFEQAGFIPIACGAFIGEHSYCTKANPIAPGRPDNNDLLQAELFGKAIKKKWNAGIIDACNMKAVSDLPMTMSAKLRFIAGVLKIKFVKSKQRNVPETDLGRCIHCGLCVRICPAGAISKENECDTDADKCIRCCACVKMCRQGAKTFNTPFAPLLSRNFYKKKPNITIV